MKSRFNNIGFKLYFVFFILIIGISFATVYQNNRSDLNVINIESKQNLEEIEKSFYQLLKLDVDKLSAALTVILRQKDLQQTFIKQDREKLLSLSLPVFDQLKQNYNITHFYYHNLDSTVFLRVDQPAIFGDLVNRFTLKDSVSTQKFSTGLELGKTAFALRVVSPSFLDGQIVGYYELGQEINNILKTIKDNTGSNNEYAIVVDKNYLSHPDWISTRTNQGLTDNWDDFGKYLNISSTISEKDSKYSQIKNCFTNFSLIDKISSLHKPVNIHTSDNSNFSCGGFPLKDASGKIVGAVLAQIDISDFRNEMNSNNQTTLINIIAFIIIAFGIYLLITEKIITKPLKKILNAMNIIKGGNLDFKVPVKSKDEIGELSSSFNEMTQNLKESKENIESRIEDRTNQLQRLNQAMVGRELKMIELKQKIKKLTNKNEK